MGSGKTLASSTEDYLQKFSLVYPFITIFQLFNGLETTKNLSSLPPLIFKKGVAPLIHTLDYFSTKPVSPSN